MARVFVTRSLPGPALDRLSAEHDVEVWPERLPPDREELLARAPELEGLLTMLTDAVDAELVEAAPRLRAISNYAVCVDNVDLEAAGGIGVGTAVNTSTTGNLNLTTSGASWNMSQDVSSTMLGKITISDGWIRFNGMRINNVLA
jgi:glyoxylate reductase